MTNRVVQKDLLRRILHWLDWAHEAAIARDDEKAPTVLNALAREVSAMLTAAPEQPSRDEGGGMSKLADAPQTPRMASACREGRGIEEGCKLEQELAALRALCEQQRAEIARLTKQAQEATAAHPLIREHVMRECIQLCINRYPYGPSYIQACKDCAEAIERAMKEGK